MTTASIKPVPVILGSNALTRLWPVSSAAASYALKSVDGGKPPLQTLLEAIVKSGDYDAPIIFIQETALKLAIAIAQQIYGNAATIIATSPHISPGVLSCLAARVQARKSIAQRLVFLPATLAASDEKTMQRHLKLFAKVGEADLSIDDDVICFVGEKYKKTAAPLLFQLAHKPAQSGILSVDRIIQAKGAAAREYLDTINDDLVILPSGPAIARPDTISKLLAQNAPTVLKACSHALDTSERIGNIDRPNAHFLTLVGRISLADILTQSPDRARILMCGNDLETVRDWSSKFVKIPKSQLFEVQTASPDSIKTITYEDRVLVLSQGQEHAVKIVDTTQNQERQEQHSSGQKITRIEEEAHSAVWKIELAPGQSLENECHFHRIESWSVVRGQGLAYLDGNPIEAKPGSTIIIAPEVCHQITNVGDTTLVFYEMRMGAMMDDDDRLLIPTKNAMNAKKRAG